MSRERLPDRRRNITESIRWGNTRVHLTAGFTDDGRLLEVFIKAGKTGSERDHQLEDVAVIISRLLQHGDRLSSIAAGIGRLPAGEPASVIGAVVNRLVLLEGAEP